MSDLLAEIIDNATRPTSAATDAPAIELRGVTRHYGDFAALRGVDIIVPRGAVCGLIGPNGAGKTTLLSILATLDEDFGGVVRIAGLDVRTQTVAVRRQIGFVPDHTAIYDALGVREFLLFFAAAAGLPKHERAAAVDEVIHRCALEPILDRPAGGLSKGLTQRLCVARALLHRPSVLLLDEPASGLDPRARIELKELLKRLAREGVTVLISSHILTELGDFCDHVIVLEHGQVKAADRVDALFAQATGRPGQAARRRLTIEIIGDVAAADAIARTLPAVFDTQRDGQLLAVTLLATPAASAALIKALVDGGIDVAAAVPERVNLEALFLSITHGGAA
ncbi:MAG TPA: ABC transporter ATP-binding protein [Myxococcota bacterium]